MNPIFQMERVSLSYGQKTVVDDINLSFFEKRIACIIGPSGSGKSTLLRALNRMNDLIPSFSLSGRITLEGRDIYNGRISPNELRQRVGMVFQKPCIFPKSIYENVIFGIKHLGRRRRSDWDEVVEEMLRQASLWNDVKDRLLRPALELSQGQQQRLAIARALAVDPRILLLDEPTSALDNRSAEAIEELVLKLSPRVGMIMVTHRLEQVKRIADDVVFICEGRVCEAGPSEQILQEPQNLQTRCYLGNGGSEE